jgi:hypothetical protein
MSVLYAGGLIVNSSAELKSNIEVAQDLDPRQAVREARAKYFQKDFLAEDAVYDPDGNLISEPKEPPVQLGVIAEELPSELTVMTGAEPGNPERFLGVDRDRMQTLLWQGQGDIQNRIDALTNGTKWIPEVSVIPSAPTTGATLYVFAGSLYAVFATGQITKLA